MQGQDAAQESAHRGEQGRRSESEGGGGEGGSGDEKQADGGGEGKQDQQQKPARAEWVVGVVCSVVVLAAVGYLFYQAFTGPSTPPLISVQVERVVPMRTGYLVEFRAVNEGSGTAANLMVEGALMRDTVAVEKSTASLAFVPAESERRGGLFFTRDPRQYRLEVRPTGFDRP